MKNITFFLLALCLISCSSYVERLKKAIEDQDVTKMEKILSSFDQHLTDPDCNELLYIAVNTNDKEIMKLLLESCDESAALKNDSAWILKFAVDNNALNAIEVLLLYGLNPDGEIFSNGHNILSWSIFNGENEIAKVAIENNANINYVYKDLTLIQLAISRDNTWAVVKLTNQGCDLYATNSKGHDAITYALSQRKYESLIEIVKHMEELPDISIQRKHLRNLILYWSDRCAGIGNAMIEKGYNINTDEPLLQIAIKEMKFDAVNWLLNVGVDPNVEYTGSRDYAKKPLDEACGKRFQMTNSIANGFSYAEDSSEVKQIDRLIERLKKY